MKEVERTALLTGEHATGVVRWATSVKSAGKAYLLVEETRGRLHQKPTRSVYNTHQSKGDPPSFNSLKQTQSLRHPRPKDPSNVTADQIMSEFPSVFDGQIRAMPGEEYHISLTDEARPFCMTTPRTIPFAYRDKLKKEMDLLVSQGIITPVTEPTEWCAPIVVTPKKDSDRIRMCVDLSKLNKFARRERYPSVTPAEAVADIVQSKAKYFTVLDALRGITSVPSMRQVSN